MNGHYTCFVRLAQEVCPLLIEAFADSVHCSLRLLLTRQGAGWFHCDDESITAANLGSVLSSEGYMLFYIKTRLEYTQ